jgi:hypothetical protein
MAVSQKGAGPLEREDASPSCATELAAAGVASIARAWGGCKAATERHTAARSRRVERRKVLFLHLPRVPSGSVRPAETGRQRLPAASAECYACAREQ